MRCVHRSSTCACAFLMLFVSIAATTQAANEEQQRLAAYVLSGIRSSRESWTTGVVAIEGSIKRHSADRSTEFAVRVTFDRLAGRYKSEILEGHLLDIGAQKGPRAGTGIFLRNDESQIAWSGQVGTPVAIRQREADLLPFVIAPDLDTIGLQPISDLLAGSSWNALDAMLAQSDLEGITESNGLHEVSWRISLTSTPGVTVRYTIVADETREFAVEKFVIDALPKPGGEWQQIAVARTAWDRVADRWVPVNVKSEETTKDTDLSLVWSALNGDIEEDAFDVQKVGIVPGELIVDYRLDPDGVIVGRIGSDDYSSMGSPARWSLARVVLFAVGGVLVAAVIVFAFSRRRS